MFKKKNATIQIKTTEDRKKRAIEHASQKGFLSLTHFIEWLIDRETK